MGRHKAPIQKDWLHVTIWCKKSEWEKMNLLSAPYATLSHWATIKLDENKDTKPHVKTKEEKALLKEEKGSSYPMCFEYSFWQSICARAEFWGMTASKYVVAILLYT